MRVRFPADPMGIGPIAALAALATLYVTGAWLGLQLAIEHDAVTLIWPPSGLALAALILFGTRLWPGVALGAFAICWIQGFTPVSAIGITIGNTLEAWVGAVLLERSLAFRPSLDRMRDVAALLGAGGLLASAIGATIGVTALWLGDGLAGQNALRLAVTWWRGDFAGIVVLTPILLLIRTGSPAWSELASRKEFWIVSILLLVVCIVAFGWPVSGEVQALAAQLPLIFVVWAGVRLGSRGAVVVTAPTLIIAIVATGRGLGPFAGADPHASTALLWLYCVGLGAVAPTLAAAIAQREVAEARSKRDAAERLLVEREHLLLRQRERIMREMHDGVGGQLISVLSMLQRGEASPDEVAEGLRRALDDMRIMIDSLESSREGLPVLLGKLRARLDPVLRRNGLTPIWRIEPADELTTLDPETALHCLRIIQEAATNVIQHARASRIRIAVSSADRAGGGLQIEVSDDGIGGEPDDAHPGRGMRNMADRAREIGAEIHFEASCPGRRVVLTRPHPGIAGRESSQWGRST